MLWNLTPESFKTFQNYLKEHNITNLQTGVETPADLPTESNNNGDVRWTQKPWMPFVWKDGQWLIIPNVGYVDPNATREMGEEAPDSVGLYYMDILNWQLYLSVGTSAYTDWVLVMTIPE